MRLTTIEEQQSMSELQKLLRTSLADRLMTIENLIEAKWRQRAKTKWIQQGDKNTKYFHAVVTHQKRINSISLVMSDGNEITQHSAKAKVFFQHFCNLIGDQGEAPLHFDLQAMYSADRLMQPEIAALEQPWTEGDIPDAISSWKSNRSPIPDGFTGKFYNAFLNILIPDLKEVFTRLNLCPHDTLYLLNDSFIVLVPKKEPASTTHDYRPISLVNGVQKIYSKIMAAKLKPLLHKLLSLNQTGFLKHKSILHGFHYAQ